jgi:hypothetical protein
MLTVDNTGQILAYLNWSKYKLYVLINGTEISNIEFDTIVKYMTFISEQKLLIYLLNKIVIVDPKVPL